MDNRKNCARRVPAIVTAAAVSVSAHGAMATNGYMTNGVTPQQKAMAGAGVATDTGVMGMALNPALGVNNTGVEACFPSFQRTAM